MTQLVSELLQKALSLSEEERAELGGSLIENLNAAVDEDAEAAWNEEMAAASKIRTPVKRRRSPPGVVRSRISSSRKARADFKAFDKLMGRRGGKRPRAGDEPPPSTRDEKKKRVSSGAKAQ